MIIVYMYVSLHKLNAMGVAEGELSLELGSWHPTGLHTMVHSRPSLQGCFGLIKIIIVNVDLLIMS